MRSWWWKILSLVLLLFTFTAGILGPVPRLHIVNETIRSLYFHVPMWFGMISLFAASSWHAFKYIRSRDIKHDIYSVQFAHVGFAFGMLGIFTGMMWANYAWGSPWHGDPKQNGAAITLLIYAAFFILRMSIAQDDQRSRLSAVYNIFAFIAMIPLLFIIPRMQDSLHPGSGGNPGFNMYDLQNNMKVVFYPASLGWILFGFWIATIRIRTRLLEEKLEDKLSG
jgi:heme exporter protein C